MKQPTSASTYRYASDANTRTRQHLLPTVKEELAAADKRLVDRAAPPATVRSRLWKWRCRRLSLGSGMVCDGPSEGIAQAGRAYLHLRFEEGSA
jgi:hypothetical protein